MLIPLFAPAAAADQVRGVQRRDDALDELRQAGPPKRCRRPVEHGRARRALAGEQVRNGRLQVVGCDFGVTVLTKLTRSRYALLREDLSSDSWQH